MDAILAHLNNDSYPKTLFNPLLQLIVNHLTPRFENDFLSSVFYNRLESELELIDSKIIAFFHEDPNGIFSANEKDDRDEIVSMICGGMANSDKESASASDKQAKPSMLERMSFWHG